MTPGSGSAQAEQQTSSFRLAAQPGEWSGAGLRDLPRGALVAIEARADGPMDLALVDAAGLEALSRGGQEPLLENSGSDTAEFSITIPESGDYFVVLDNRRGAEPRTATVRVSASAPGGASGTDYLASANAMLAQVAEALRRVFRLDGLDMRVEPCGEVRSFSDASDDVVVCAEYATLLLETVRDAPASSPVMMFAIFQRLAERLAEADGRTLTDREADELATALMVLLGYGEHARTAAAHYQRPAAAEELAHNLVKSVRYVLTAERAESVAGAAADPARLGGWRALLVSNLRTEILERLAGSPPEWIGAEAIEAELANRRSD